MSKMVYYVDLLALTADGWVKVLTVEFDTFEEASKAVEDATQDPVENSEQRFVVRRQRRLDDMPRRLVV